MDIIILIVLLIVARACFQGALSILGKMLDAWIEKNNKSE